MKKIFYKLLLPIIAILLLNNCKKEAADYPCVYELVDVVKDPIEVYTTNDTIENYNSSLGNVFNQDHFQNIIVNQIYFTSSVNASFKFNEGDFKAVMDYYYSNLSVSNKKDSIFFDAIFINQLNGKEDTVSAKGVYNENTIQIFGLYFVSNRVYHGIEYREFNKNKIFEKIKAQPNDTLVLFRFTLNYIKKLNK